MRVVDLTTEYQRDPMGLDTIPRFSWKIESRYKNTLQQGYQIVVKSDETKIWDSGRVESRQSLFVEYQGEELSPCTVYTVEVRVWDKHGERGAAWRKFETGLLSQDNWQAEWITHSLPPEEEACPVFIRKFHTEKKRIVLARVYAACRGVYELEVNGRKAGDAFLAPGWTSYHNRIQYQTYDITKLLLSGKGEEAENLFKITVGNGWYKGYLNGEGRNCFYGDRTAVLAMFRIIYEDGSVQIVGTDTEWKVTTGIIRASELYHGETQDFSFETLPEIQADRAVLWKKTEGSPQTTAHQSESGNVTEEHSESGCTPERHSEPGRTAEEYSEPSRTAEEHSQPIRITAQQSEPVRVTKRLPARRKILTPRGELVLDFGQNLAGFVEVKLPELQGEALRIFHAEALDKEGNFYTENLRTARSTDTYVYTGREVGRVVHPHFTYHGFRYIRLEGVDQDVDMECFTACALHTDMEQTGYFSCDYEPVSRLQRNIEWTQRSNFVDIPTDCPQRDERLGWTGDAQVFCRTAMYQFNTALFYKKWLRDLAAESDDEQGIPQMVPNFMGASRGTSVWGDCAVILPWTLYQVYGDEAVLREQYPNMRSWIDYISRACGENTLWMDGFQRGDWLGLDGDESLHSLSGGTDRNLVANAYYAHSCRILPDPAGCRRGIGTAGGRGEVRGAV